MLTWRMYKVVCYCSTQLNHLFFSTDSTKDRTWYILGLGDMENKPINQYIYIFFNLYLTQKSYVQK